MNTPYVIAIEDNRNDIILMQRIFDKHIPDCNVQFLEDGEAAITFMQSEDYKNNPPKVILLDIKIPKITGLEVLKTLRSTVKTPYVPVVMLSSSDRIEDINQSYTNGANSYIEKPKDFIELKSKLTTIINYWLTYNRL